MAPGPRQRPVGPPNRGLPGSAAGYAVATVGATSMWGIAVTLAAFRAISVQVAESIEAHRHVGVWAVWEWSRLLPRPSEKPCNRPVSTPPERPSLG